ncbi:MAG: BMC domain-containing protein [Dorea sp.]|jgi:microcompartment protein CcmL/EutN|nr:BMC domain-containing protein [Dorea sp.]
MGVSIGAVELNSVAAGVVAGDAMLKAANVDLVVAQPTCPGKFIVIVAGDTASVETAVAAGCAEGRDKVVDTLMIASVAGEVIPAIMRTSAPEQRESVGVIETFSLASAVLAADYAVKSAAIDLIEVRLGRGLGGKAFVVVTGRVSDVTTAADYARSQLAKEGMVLNITVVPSLHPDLYQALL